MNYNSVTELSSGDLIYTLDKKLHRLDGAAVIYNSHAEDQYWVDDKHCDDFEDYKRKVREYKIKQLVGK